MSSIICLPRTPVRRSTGDSLVPGPPVKHQSGRKRKKYFLRRLRECQLLDIYLTGGFCMEMKHRFSTTSRIPTVHVVVDNTFRSPTNVSRHQIPSFIVSQLEAQSFIKTNKVKVPVNPPLYFVLATLSENPASSKDAYPTLFRWYLPDTHRSYWLFAFLSYAMTTTTYSVEQLLSLRNSISPTVEEVLSRIAKDEPDITAIGLAEMLTILPYEEDVVRIRPTEVLRAINIGSTSNPAAKRVGRARVDTLSQAHNAKELTVPHQTQIQPQHLRNVAQQGYHEHQASHQTPQQASQASSQERSGTETSPSEPLPKPTDFPVQEAKGFKKFYKAVVSPSHVRVTAGGRIVPNNRAPGSPTPKATRPNPSASTAAIFNNANPPHFPTAGASFPSVRPQATAYNTLPTAPAQVLPQLPTQIGYLPTEHGWVQVPIAFAPPGYAVMKTPFPAGSIYPGVFPAAQPQKGAVEKDKESDVNQPGVPGITPASLVPGAYIPQVASHPGLVIPQAGGSMPSRRNPSPNSAARGGGYHPSMLMGTALSSALNLTMSSPVQSLTPPASSIKASEITKCHIERMKEVIRYNEDQIQLNKHQVDEKALLEQNEQVKTLIETFQKTYEMQIKVEENFKSKDTAGHSDPSRSLGPNALARMSDPSGRHTGLDVESVGNRQARSHLSGNSSFGLSLDEPRPSSRSGQPSRQQPISQASHPYNVTGAEGQLNVKPTSGPQGHQTDLSKRSSWTSLPIEAAAAAPFQPRSDLTPSERAYYAKPFESSTGSEGQIDPSSRTFGIRKSGRHVTFGPDSGFQAPGLGTPYLCGQLPRGGNPRDGYVYNRELTEEEKQSRYLYWGRASRAARKGLPKFDGQHFYPPSPSKERESVQGLFQCAERGGPNVGTPQRGEGADQLCKMNVFGKIGRSEDKEVPPSTSAPGQVSTRTSSEFLRNIIKKGPAGGNALPSTVSSTTALGVLPQYAGHAAASLTPAMTEPTLSSTDPKIDGMAPAADLPDAELKLRELAIEDLRKGGLVAPE
ncbi:hypothetical protein MKZ38_009789 [Zalerion maritima]|uniref:Uncharacterized protein n=1 Tax=Zalerion maritima TaxID=339359 RepID=A0AAD5RZV9_9PEZI|nr:hypothetical protein MKZ38_009789 [Zalerion maritima]